MVIHNGRSIPLFPEAWDPSDKDWVWIVWDEVLNGATITASAWVLPAGWVSTSTKQSQSVTDETGATYSAANGALISNSSATVGSKVTVSNQVTLSDGRQYERSVSFLIAPQ